MKKKLLILSTSVLLFTACGNSSSSSNSFENGSTSNARDNNPSINDFKARTFMIMGQNTAVSECNTNFIKQAIKGAIFSNRWEYPSEIDKNSVLVLLENQTVPCSDYNRVDDIAGNCFEVDLEERTGQTCIIGFNLIR